MLGCMHPSELSTSFAHGETFNFWSMIRIFVFPTFQFWNDILEMKSCFSNRSRWCRYHAVLEVRIRSRSSENQFELVFVILLSEFVVSYLTTELSNKHMKTRFGIVLQAPWTVWNFKHITITASTSSFIKTTFHFSKVSYENWNLQKTKFLIIDQNLKVFRCANAIESSVGCIQASMLLPHSKSNKGASKQRLRTTLVH